MPRKLTYQLVMPFLRIFKYFISFCLLINFAFGQSKNQIVLPILNDSSFIYESTLSYKNNNFGGLLITQKQKDKLRVALSSKFGMKIFDFLLSKDSIHTIYAIEQLDKNIIKKMFYKDFKMIYPFLYGTKNIKQKKNRVIIKNKCTRYKYVYSENKLIKIKKGVGFTKAEISNKNQEIEDLEIIHSLIGLKIKIKPLILSNE